MRSDPHTHARTTVENAAGVQRLEAVIAVALARERRAPANGCTALAAALATLPSGLLEMVARAVAALGCADLRDEFTLS